MEHVVLTSYSKMSLGVDLAAQVGNCENCVNGKRDVDYICRLSAIVQEKLSKWKEDVLKLALSGNF